MTPPRVLAIGAHPDDAEFFAGGALAGFAAQGAEVGIVVCTDGARGGATGGEALAGRRRAEAERAATTLGIRAPVFLGHADGSLVADDALRRDLVREIRRERPDLVLLHDPTTLWTPLGETVHLGHSDHRAAGQATLDAVYPRLLLASFYPDLVDEGFAPWLVRELWLFDTARPDHFVPIADTSERKRRALACHESQHVPGLLAAASAIESAFSCGAGHEAFRRLRLV
ncbi:MAG: PIG-L family deacetylase [Deltaproteobacteria bacterium]|nr:PIG-L family deacetylase [Deltaproteobacteria bacterium]